MAKVNATLITRHDWDFEWQKSNLVLYPGELAISIPTKEAEAGDPVIDGTGEIGSGARTVDSEHEMILKIGNNDTFLDHTTLIPNGTAGVLVNLKKEGTFSAEQEEPVKVKRDENTGFTVISIREAKVTTLDGTIIQSTQSGVLSALDYKNLANIAEYFKDPANDQFTEVTQESILANLKPQVDKSLKYDENGKLGVSDNIYWHCAGAEEEPEAIDE